MGRWIELNPEGGGAIAAWRADPAGKPRGGIVVIQEIFGVNAHIRAVADRFAAEGYLAVAPAIFDHVEKGFDVGYDPESRARGMAVALLGEPFAAYQALALVLVVGGIAIAQKGAARTQAAHTR